MKSFRRPATIPDQVKVKSLGGTGRSSLKTRSLETLLQHTKMQIVIKDNRKKVNRKAVTFKCRLIRVLSKCSLMFWIIITKIRNKKWANNEISGKRKVEKHEKSRGSVNVSVAKLEGIQVKNKQLADALNKAKIQIAIMQNQIRDTRDQNLDLRVENATQRDEIRRLKVY